MRKTLLIFSLIVLMLSSCNRGNQVPAGIQGRVLDSESGNPIPLVTLYTDPPTMSILSDKDGAYGIIDIPAGTYTVTAQKQGYMSISVRVTVFPGKRVIGDIALGRDALGR
jgi:hypothetical protein